MRFSSVRRFARPLTLVAVPLLLLGLQPAAASNDPYYSMQWNMHQIHAEDAWPVSTGAGIKIGIVDSGVNNKHEDLAGRIAGTATCVGTTGDASQCVTGSSAGDDIDGHGTHVAGIAVGDSNNGKGIAGTAPGAQILMARVFKPGPAPGDEPSASLDDVKAGIRWVISQGAKVVNLSIGAEEQGFNLCTVFANCQSPLRPVIQEAWAMGVLPIIAAGNSQFYGQSGYGNIDAIVVGATNPDDVVANYSTSIGNAKWAILAPGGDTPSNPANPSQRDKDRLVLSTFAGARCSPPSDPTCYAYLAGTSMAAPHVSGVAAMLFAKGLSRSAVIDTLLTTGDDIPCENDTRTCPRLNASAALGIAANNNNSNNNGSTTQTTRKSSNPRTSTPATTSTTAFGFTQPTAAETFDQPTTTTAPLSGAAAVLRQAERAGAGGEIPVWLGLGGVFSLAAAALTLSQSLRKTLTTLP